MMRSSNSKAQGKVEAVNSESPLENGLPPKEEEDDMGQNVRELAAKVVDDVVKMASEAAQQRTSAHSTPTKNRGCNLQRLPTIQIDTVPSPPPSPVELTPPEELNEIEEALDESEIQLDLDNTEQDSENSSEDLKDFLKSYVEDILSQAMVLAEKKLQFAGLPDEDEEGEPEPEPEPVETSPEPAREPEKEIIDESEVRATAEKVVQEVIEKASETAAEKLENSLADLNFPDLPSIEIDTCKSAPPSPEIEEEEQAPQKKWSFKVDEDSDSEKNLEPEEEKQPPPDLPSIQIDTCKSAPPSPETEEEEQAPQKKWSFKVDEDSYREKNLEPEEEKQPPLIKFDDAPEDVKEAATSFVKEIVGKAVAMVEEKSVPTVPFNFEDVELMKTSGPWYIRAREALIRLLRTACFCTPRRTDS